MNKKLMLLAAGALTALAFAALPAVASAGTPETHCPGAAGTSCSFTVHGPPGELWTTENLGVRCTSTTGVGTMGTKGGSIQLTFHGCTETIFGSSCTTTGQPSGTIKTTVLPYDNVYTTAGKTQPGVLVTPPAGSQHFASFSCFGGLSNHVVSGNGVIGDLITPKCGGSSNALTLDFNQTSNGHQQRKQITGAGTIFDLNDNGVTASMDAHGTVTIAGGGSAVVTCV